MDRDTVEARPSTAPRYPITLIAGDASHSKGVALRADFTIHC